MSCNQCNDTPCVEQNCGCKVYLTSDCITVKSVFSCFEIASELTLTETLEALDEAICDRLATVTNYFTLVNTGTGSELYNGVNNLGQKKIRKINRTGLLVTVIQNTDDISISIDEAEMIKFVQLNQILYTAANVGAGAEVYKNTTGTTLKTFNFRKIKKVNLGATGIEILNDIVVHEDDVEVRVKKLNSSTLTITDDGSIILINQPLTTEIPAIIVNNFHTISYQEWLLLGGNLDPLYVYKGFGTLSKQFTDSTAFTNSVTKVVTPNTALKNALDHYVGTGTRLQPQRENQQIVVQKNSTGHTHPLDLNYSSLDLLLEGNINCTTTSWLVNMDDPTRFNANNSTFTINIEEGAVLDVSSTLGFKNSGNTNTTLPAFEPGRIGLILGDGLVYSSYNGENVLTRYIFNGDGNFNDSGLHFEIRCRVRADFQGVYLTKDYQRIDFYNLIQSGLFLGSVNIALQAFKMEGGQVRFYEKGAIHIGSETSSRTYGVTFEPSQRLGSDLCRFELNSAKVNYVCRYVFAKLNDLNVDFIGFNSQGTGNTVFPFGSSTIENGLFFNHGASLWQVSFNNNTYQFTGIDFTEVDLTMGNSVSSFNTIGSNIYETLVVYPSKQLAKTVLVNNSKFLKRVTVISGSFVGGLEYKIVTIGNTDFTSIGASANTIGMWFTATGPGAGTGTAVLESIEIV